MIFLPTPKTDSTALSGTSVCANPSNSPCENAPKDQYQRELDTLTRIELRRECFFDVMGEMHYNQIITLGVDSARAAT